MRHLRRKRQGIVFILALVSLIVTMITGVTFMGMTAHQLGNARRSMAAVQALALAEGGANYAIWQQNFSKNRVTDPPGTLVDDLRTLRPQSSPAPNWHIVPPTGEADAYVWISKYPANCSQGYQVVSLGTYHGYTRMVRAVFEAATTDTPTDNSDAETLIFNHTLFTNTSLSFTSDCAIGGDTVVNGDLYMGNSGRFVKVNGSGGNVNVAGNLKMDGNARVEGTATAKGNVDLSGGSPRITGALNALGTLHVANAGITLNNATVNGNATVEGSTLTGVLTTAGDFTNTGWGNEPTSVLYGGKYTNTGTRDYNSISHKTNVTPLPATTGDPLPMPIINIDKYQLSSYGKKIIPSKGTYTVNNGSPQFTDSQVYLDGNMSFSGGPNLMKLPPNMSWYINGDFNSSCNTTLTGTDVTLYVKGNINIGGTFNFNATGKVIIIADGTINIGGGYNFGNTNVVLMSKTAITIGRNTPINAQIYVHSSDPSKKGVFTANSPDIRGAVICDQAVFTGNGNTFTYKPPSYPFLPPGNDDTGDTTRAWSVASWELLF